MVSALLVGIMSVGVLNSIDGAQKVSGRDKSRSVAASLAQQDQERLRSMTVSNLSTVSSTPRQATVCANGASGCVRYYVASQSSWVADSSSTSTCTLSSARSYNLQVTSTVTWDGQGNAPSIVQKSLVAAPPGTSGGAQGSLAVRLREVDGITPLSGVSVNLTGPGGIS